MAAIARSKHVALGVPALPRALPATVIAVGAPVAGKIVLPSPPSMVSAPAPPSVLGSSSRAVRVVSVVRPVDALDSGERVALGVPALPRARRQVDGDARIGAPVPAQSYDRRRRRACPRPRRRADGRSLRTTLAVPGCRCPLGPGGRCRDRRHEQVGVAGPLEFLDSRQAVAPGVSALLPPARRQVDRHARVGPTVRPPALDAPSRCPGEPRRPPSGVAIRPARPGEMVGVIRPDARSGCPRSALHLSDRYAHVGLDGSGRCRRQLRRSSMSAPASPLSQSSPAPPSRVSSPSPPMEVVVHVVADEVIRMV